MTEPGTLVHLCMQLSNFLGVQVGAIVILSDHVFN